MRRMAEVELEEMVEEVEKKTECTGSRANSIRTEEEAEEDDVRCRRGVGQKGGC